MCLFYSGCKLLPCPCFVLFRYSGGFGPGVGMYYGGPPGSPYSPLMGPPGPEQMTAMGYGEP